jgi:tRNA pseudouridine38-40 synthase
MSRYFIEVAYKGTRYSGFQVQENAITIQYEIEKALQVLHRVPVQLTGSSRTDAGVHAYQNYFHFDFDDEKINPQFVYKMNAILPGDVVVKSIRQMHSEAHARFDATGRSYRYHLHRFKNPFLQETSFFFPYKLELDKMKEAAAFVKSQTNFSAFSKTNTQVKNFNCAVTRSEWTEEGDQLVFIIEGNRFLRGMVRLLTATLLKLGRGKLSLEEFSAFFVTGEKCGYSVPAHGLVLTGVHYPENYFPASGGPFTGF